MKSSKDHILSFIREITIVVIGILVALFINNWNEDIKQRKFINKTFYAIGEEIRFSKNEIEGILDKHYRTIDSIQASYDNQEESLRDILIKMEGFQIPEIKNIGLRFFVTHSAELVNYEIISDLSEIEFFNNSYEMKIAKLNDIVYTYMESTEKKDKNLFIQLLADIVENEESLLELYKAFLLKHQDKLQQ